MRTLSTAVEAAIQAEIVSRTVAIEMDFPSGMVRVNGSPSDFQILGNTYLGIGGLGGISATEESAELRAYGLTLSLSGIPRDMVAVALGQAYQGRRVTVWEVIFDTTSWAVLADPVVVFRGRMDTMDVRLGETATIIVKAENRLADWERPRIRRYTDEDQQQAYPGDRGFRFVSATAEKEIVWPGKGAV
ncbi:MAG: hypothetical protein WCP77_00960 [Roseococcus sp.]